MTRTFAMLGTASVLALAAATAAALFINLRLSILPPLFNMTDSEVGYLDDRLVAISDLPKLKCSWVKQTCYRASLLNGGSLNFVAND